MIEHLVDSLLSDGVQPQTADIWDPRLLNFHLSCLFRGFSNRLEYKYQIVCSLYLLPYHKTSFVSCHKLQIRSRFLYVEQNKRKPGGKFCLFPVHPTTQPSSKDREYGKDEWRDYHIFWLVKRAALEPASGALGLRPGEAEASTVVQSVTTYTTLPPPSPAHSTITCTTEYNYNGTSCLGQSCPPLIESGQLWRWLGWVWRRWWIILDKAAVDKVWNPQYHWSPHPFMHIIAHSKPFSLSGSCR